MKNNIESDVSPVVPLSADVLNRIEQPIRKLLAAAIDEALTDETSDLYSDVWSNVIACLPETLKQR
jgi:hypothetical protein